jgi:hypothetical protein
MFFNFDLHVHGLFRVPENRLKGYATEPAAAKRGFMGLRVAPLGSIQQGSKIP